MTDKEIREMLLEVEEPVSPAVWKGVAAGLDARARVVPFWVWGAVAVAAAAAVVLGVFLFKPSAGPALEPYNGNLVAQVENSLSYDIAEPVVYKAAQAPAPASAPVTATPVVASPAKSLEAVEQANFKPSAVTQKRVARLVMPRNVVTYSPSIDNYALLDMLAAQEEQKYRGEFSLTASGNVQAGNKAKAFSRRVASSPGNQEGEGLSNPTEDKPGMPFSVGLGLRWNFTPRWSLSVGARYTNLSRSFRANYNSGEGWTEYGRPVDNKQHWIGIPVDVHYNIVNAPRFKVHVFGGGAVDYLMQNKFTIYGGNGTYYWNKGGASFQWSAEAGAGVEFKIVRWLGIYLDPCVRYYFNQASGADINGLPVHPVRFVIDGGLRFCF